MSLTLYGSLSLGITPVGMFVLRGGGGGPAAEDGGMLMATFGQSIAFFGKLMASVADTIHRLVNRSINAQLTHNSVAHLIASLN